MTADNQPTAPQDAGRTRRRDYSRIFLTVFAVAPILLLPFAWAAFELPFNAIAIVAAMVVSRGGTCLGCFRPALVMNVRKAKTYTFRWDGQPKPSVSVVR